MFPQSSERRSHKHLVWSDTGSKCQWIGLPNAASRSTLGPSLALGNIDLIQHSSRKHVLGDCIMFFAGNLVHGLKDEFQSIHGLPPWVSVLSTSTNTLCRHAGCQIQRTSM